MFQNIRKDDGVEFTVVERQRLGKVAFKIEKISIMLRVFPVDANGLCDVGGEEGSFAASQIEKSSMGMMGNGIAVKFRNQISRQPRSNVDFFRVS